jgi:hypothetical protein
MSIGWDTPELLDPPGVTPPDNEALKHILRRTMQDDRITAFESFSLLPQAPEPDRRLAIRFVGAHGSADTPGGSTNRWPSLLVVLLATLLASVFLVSGVILFVESVLPHATRPNPYAATSLLLTGVGLFVTLLVGIRAKEEESGT